MIFDRGLVTKMCMYVVCAYSYVLTKPNRLDIMVNIEVYSVLMSEYGYERLLCGKESVCTVTTSILKSCMKIASLMKYPPENLLGMKYTLQYPPDTMADPVLMTRVRYMTERSPYVEG